jgi:threonylcarbamoyladenosine tRNA methylthiotransferase MtaB
MRVKLHTLGCRLNEAETEAWARELCAHGHHLCREDEAADLVVVNTCAVTQEAVRKSGQILRRSRRDDPDARLVVSGCAVSLPCSTSTLSQTVDLLVPNTDKDRLVEISNRRLDLPCGPEQACDAGGNTLFARSRQRAFVKVQDGCRHRCAYCIITLARGAERSRPIADLVAEVRGLSTAGVDEVVLTGVHLGGYGSDRPGEDLLTLTRALLAETPIRRLRIGSLEPWDLPGGFWDLFCDARLMPHLHLPIQSGSDAVLRRMTRRGRACDFLALAAAAHTAVPDLNLTTDVIAGFPGETEAQWQETLALVEAIGFGDIHVFPFSPRPGTKAADLSGQVRPKVARARAQQLRQLAERLRRAALLRMIGRQTEVLVEGREDPTVPAAERLGYTPGYLPVRIVGLSDRIGRGHRIRWVRLTGVTPGGEALVGVEDPPRGGTRDGYPEPLNRRMPIDLATEPSSRVRASRPAAGRAEWPRLRPGARRGVRRPG